MNEQQAKFTPGPWKALPEETGRDYIRIRGTRLGGRYKVANVVMADLPREVDETRANARLIAAAPDLLSALDRLAHSYRLLLARKPVRDVEETLAEVDHAIAKATGSNP